MAGKKEKKRPFINKRSELKPELLLSQFEKLAERLEIRIIYGKGDFVGGGCQVMDQRYIVINKVRPTEQQLHILALEFYRLGLDGMYVLPVLRSFIEQEYKKC
jgi:hypothetical protein